MDAPLPDAVLRLGDILMIEGEPHAEAKLRVVFEKGIAPRRAPPFGHRILRVLAPREQDDLKTSSVVEDTKRSGARTGWRRMKTWRMLK